MRKQTLYSKRPNLLIGFHGCDKSTIFRNLLAHTDFFDEQIAKLAEVSEEYVAKLRKSMK